MSLVSRSVVLTVFSRNQTERLAWLGLARIMISATAHVFLFFFYAAIL